MSDDEAGPMLSAGIDAIVVAVRQAERLTGCGRSLERVVADIGGIEDADSLGPELAVALEKIQEAHAALLSAAMTALTLLSVKVEQL